ncbi:MAG: cadherin domain-containing protein, partial [Pirellulaceae bacterium]|nr:cadherin domain-containing protein [Pirellulaceae bacterium]
VTGTNDGPVAPAGTNTAPEDGAVVNGTLSETDADTNDTHPYALITNTSEGSVTVQANGDYSFDPGADFQDLALGETRDVMFTYEVTDNHGATSQAVVTITVTGTNDEQVIANNLGMTVDEGTTGSVLTSAMLATTDVDNLDSELVYTVSTQTVNGTLRLNGAALAINDTFTQADIAAGRVGYDHNGSETSSDSFAFTVDDGIGGASNGSFVISVSPVNNHTPVITSNGGGASATIHVDENSAAITTVTATDGDLPIPTLTYSLVGGVDSGWFTIDANTGELQFIAGRDRESATDFDGDHTYEVIVRASDGTLSTTQAISVVIDDVNEFGVGTVTDTNASANQVNENSAPGTLVGLTVKATDSDATNNTITYSLVDDDHGRFAIDSVTGVVRLIGPVDYEADGASRTIRAQATSSDGSFSQSDFSIAIVNANEAPQAVPGEYTTSYIDDLAVNLLSNAVNGVDPDGDVVTAVIVQGPASGTATLLGDGSLRYRPQAGFVGTVSLTYYVTDGNLNSAVETVLIHVILPTNLPPADMGGGGGTGSTSGTGSGGATSTASPPSQAANHSLSAPGPIDQSSQAAASTHVVQVAIAQLDTSTARALQTVELARDDANNQTQLFLNGLAGMDLHSPETERLEFDANHRMVFKQASMTQLVFAEVSELIDADSQSDWISQIDPYVATAVGTGIVIWLVHAGQFAAALLSTASTWVQLDPLTVLQGAGESEVGESLEEKMFERKVD